MSSRYAYDGKKPAVLLGYYVAKLARRFNALRPSLSGRYAEAITTDSEDPQDAIRRFKGEEYPLIAVSVGMLDTGFDCPGVVNIAFCRPMLLNRQQLKGNCLPAGVLGQIPPFEGSAIMIETVLTNRDSTIHETERMGGVGSRQL